MSNVELKPARVFEQFAKINQIPRPSKREEKMIEYLKEFGKNHGLETVVDETGNVLIRKPATPGHENRKTVILQSHMDMVCDKLVDVEFDFDKDAIQTYVDGEWLRAKGTTLGADDGIGCAIELAVLDSDDIEHRNRMEMNGIFSWELGKGEHSRILFRKDGVELAELVYNPKTDEQTNDHVGMKDLVVPTVPQKPDIVLQLTKNDLLQGMKMTYLFDAKYRIDDKEQDVDLPPDDAINQMHRYRDAIYYKDYDAKALKKEVIGGYILFPGDGKPSDVAVSKFYKTIKEVNIGAFPLRPKDVENRKLLEQFIAQLVHTKSYETIAQVIPQKGAYVEVGNRVLIGLVKDDNRQYQAFMDGTATLYYTGRQFPTTIALQDLHFFMPYIKGQGVRDVYEITRVRTITSKEAKQTDKEDADSKSLRLAFELRYVRKQYTAPRPIDPTKMIGYTFVDTTFDKLEECVGIEEG